jgi:hypothetical protein
MRRAAGGALAGVALLLAGCGEEAARPSVPPEQPLVSGPALERLVSGCGLPRGKEVRATSPPDPAASLVPPPAKLIESRRTGRGHRAVAVVGAAPGRGVEAFVEHAQARGYVLDLTEDEGFEADAVLHRLDDVALVKVYAGSCANASRAIVTVSGR